MVSVRHTINALQIEMKTVELSYLQELLFEIDCVLTRTNQQASPANSVQIIIIGEDNYLGKLYHFG